MQLDTVIQTLFKFISNIKWRYCESNDRLCWYYAEDCHYLVKDKATGGIWLVKAKSPSKACESVIGKLGI